MDIKVFYIRMLDGLYPALCYQTMLMKKLSFWQIYNLHYSYVSVISTG